MSTQGLVFCTVLPLCQTAWLQSAPLFKVNKAYVVSGAVAGGQREGGGCSDQFWWPHRSCARRHQAVTVGRMVHLTRCSLEELDCIIECDSFSDFKCSLLDKEKKINETN